MKDLIPVAPVDYADRRVLTTAQIAKAYNVSTNVIKENFRRAQKHFVEGVHYFKVEGGALRELKASLSEGKLFDLPLTATKTDTPLGISKYASCLYLWTEQGAARHCKMINTTEAWNMFNVLENAYFNNTAPTTPHTDHTDVYARLDEIKAALQALLETARENQAVFKKTLGKLERAEKLLEVARLITPSPERDKLLFKAANLFIGERLF